MSNAKVLLVMSSFDRWIIKPVHASNLGWSGARWVEHVEGVGIIAQVCNFQSLGEATEYAHRMGFDVVGIEQEM